MNDLRLFAPPSPAFHSRRDFLARAGNGFGMLALGSLLAQEGFAAPAADPLAPRPSHFPAKAKSDH